jgi:hypothetical protein
VKFPAIATLDTSKTPKAGDARLITPVLAGVDISKLKTGLERIEARHTGKAAPPKRQRAKPAAKRAVKPVQQKPAKRAPSGDPIAAAILRARTVASLTPDADTAGRTHQNRSGQYRPSRKRPEIDDEAVPRRGRDTLHGADRRLRPAAFGMNRSNRPDADSTSFAALR